MLSVINFMHSKRHNEATAVSAQLTVTKIIEILSCYELRCQHNEQQFKFIVIHFMIRVNSFDFNSFYDLLHLRSSTLIIISDYIIFLLLIISRIHFKYSLFYRLYFHSGASFQLLRVQMVRRLDEN